MSKNDEIVLKEHFQDWKRRTDDLDGIDPWLYYCLEQFLKPYAIDDEDLESGIMDGGGDGGVDGHYFLLNNRQIITADTDIDPKSASSIRLLFFQVKHSGGIKPTEIEKWLTTTDDFFDLSKDPNKYGVRYNKTMKSAMRVWRDQYLKVSGNFPEVAVDFYYVTGDDAVPNEHALDACNRVKDRLEKAYKWTCTVHTIGAEQLWRQVQKRPKNSRIIKWAEQPMSTDDGYVGLVGLPDFRGFLEDDDGSIAERIFESNVRGFVHTSGVNGDIAKTLLDPADEPNFWLLNNGVTIIAAKAASAHRLLTVEDPQIVNGLQTSRMIFDCINKDAKDSRTVLVRVIETTDQKKQDRIIKATNSQNRMQPASLRMTDQIHRDIEEYFKGDGLFYDRRRGFYKDQGKQIKKIVSVNAVAQAVISIMLQRPDDARARPGDYFKEEGRYKSIFSSAKITLPVYLSCVKIVRHVDAFLTRSGIERSDKKNLLFYVAAAAVRQYTGLKMPVSAKLPKASQLGDELLTTTLRNVSKFYYKLAQTAGGDSVARGPLLLKKINSQWDRQHRNARRR